MWYEQRKSQHRAYWRTETGRTYEAFGTEADARAFIGDCKQYGREVILAILHGTAAEAPEQGYDPETSLTLDEIQAAMVLPPLPARIRVPEPAGMTLRWLGEQYAESGNRGNEQTRDDYRRDLQRYVYPYFRQDVDGDIDIALIQTRPLPTLDGTEWPVPTISGWKAWLQQQPRHDRDGKPRPGTVLADKTRRNIESLLSQVFNFALDYDPQPLLDRNPFGRLGLTTPEVRECVWLERNAAELVLECLAPWYRPLVKFLLSTGVRWGEAAALQVKDVHLGDGTEHDPAWVFVHKTWKPLEKKSPAEAKATGKTYTWGRGRTKTAAGRRRITLHPSLRAELLPLLSGRDGEDPVFTGPQGGILNNNNFTERALKPALAKARELLAVKRATATPEELLVLPREIPDIRPHAFRHSHAAWLLSAGRPEAEVQRRLGHADPNTTKKLYGHLTEEVSKETVRFLQKHLESIMMIGRDGVVSAAEDRTIDTPDAVDRALPLVDGDEDGEEKAAAA